VRSRGAAGGDEDVRPVAGVLPPGVEAQLALPHRVRHHRIPHHQDDGQLHRGGPQELQVRPGAQEALTRPGGGVARFAYAVGQFCYACLNEKIVPLPFPPFI